MSIVNIVKEPEYYYPAGMAEQDGLMTYRESQKLDNIPTPSNIVTKSSTAGLLKNDGTVDSNSYVKKSDIETEKTASGNPITLTDAIAGNAIDVSAEIVASQDLHGYDKPWVGGAGKNKFDPTIVWKRNNASGFNGSGVDDNDMRARTVPAFAFDRVGTFTISGLPTEVTTLIQVVCYDAEKVSLGLATVDGFTFTTLSGTKHIHILLGGSGFNDITFDSSTMQIEEGQTATTFEPYANICPITGASSVTVSNTDEESTTVDVTVALGSTVYGGTLDLTSGELTVTHANIASYNGETIGEPWISSMDEYTQGGTPTTGAQVVYTLATPTTTTLTAAQLALVKGYNQLSCNSGDMSITYKASSLDAWKDRVDELEDRVDDVETELASKAEKTTIAPIENGTKASKNYSFGEYFVKDNKLDKAITSIASGATLTKNTNYTESTIGEELKRINTNIGLGETVSADMANCLPPRFKDISNDFFNGSLRSEIAAGNFKNVRPGDYIVYSSSGKNFKFVVCDCDYWYNKGDTNCTTHHLRVMLTECTGITELWAGLTYDGGTGHWSGVLRCPWNAATDVDPTSASAVGSNNTNITRNGASAYAGSFVRDRLVTRILPEVFNLAFGSSNVLKVRNLLSNAVDTSKPSGGSSAWNGIASGLGWFDSYLELPSEIELYGSTVFSSSGFDTCCQDKQLAIFKNASLDTVLGRNDVWTKAVVSSSHAAYRSSGGSANRDGASRACWAFPLGNIK